VGVGVLNAPFTIAQGGLLDKGFIAANHGLNIFISRRLQAEQLKLAKVGTHP
jgi:hypothetical protein